VTAPGLRALFLLGPIAAIVPAVAAPPAQAAPATSSYRVHVVPWPGGVVRYYNAAPSQGWVLWQAVSAWNRSGAKSDSPNAPWAREPLRLRAWSNGASGRLAAAGEPDLHALPFGEAGQEHQRPAPKSCVQSSPRSAEKPYQ